MLRVIYWGLQTGYIEPRSEKADQVFSSYHTVVFYRDFLFTKSKNHQICSLFLLLGLTHRSLHLLLLLTKVVFIFHFCKLCWLLILSLWFWYSVEHMVFFFLEYQARHILPPYLVPQHQHFSPTCDVFCPECDFWYSRKKNSIHR